jgi:hypothetical protein
MIYLETVWVSELKCRKWVYTEYLTLPVPTIQGEGPIPAVLLVLDYAPQPMISLFW